MAILISSGNYTTISDYYADLRAQLNGTVHYLQNAVDLIVQLDDAEPTLDLLQDFYNVYLTQTAAIRSDAPFLNVVRALNNHVLRRGGYSSLNAYLFANSIHVDNNWANMCESAGYTVDDTYVL